MPEPVTVDGSMGLDEQNRALNFYQQQHRSKVVAYERDEAAGSPQNIATSEQLPLGTKIPTLQLVAIPAGSNIAGVQLANTTLTFDSIVFVDATPTRVAGFHTSNA